MKKLALFLLLIGAILGGGYLYRSSGIQNPEEKIYVAVEGEGRIAVIDSAKGEVIRSIDLSLEHDGERMVFSPHNVQVAPNGETVWVTANVGSHAHSSGPVNTAYAAEDHESGDGHGDDHMMMDHEHGGDEDQVIVISAATDRIVERISIGKGLHLAHIVLTPDNRYAYATAQTEGAIYKINAVNLRLEKRISAGDGTEPHGLRISPDGKAAYIAMLKAKKMGILTLAEDRLDTVPLSGAPVQGGVTPDGKYAVASIYDKKQLAVYDIASAKLDYVNLPPGAKGPVQMYATPDSRFVYLADQGFYFGEPESNKVYKIDIAGRKVAGEITAGKAPHGVVADKAGEKIYVTNLNDGTVSVIAAASDAEEKKIYVGKEPNGISIWSKTGGGTP